MDMMSTMRLDFGGTRRRGGPKLPASRVGLDGQAAAPALGNLSVTVPPYN